MTVSFSLADLAPFNNGTDQLYYHPLFRNGPRYTDGVQFVSAHGCGWFVEMILAENISHPWLAAEPFQVWALTAHAQGRGVVHVTDGNERTLLRKNLDYTDWPEGEPLTLWVTDRTILLPSEY